jgi:tRNA G26 N,N-dimethylase Trm1
MSNWAGISSLTTERRIQGIVAVMDEELDAPLYYVVDQLCAVLKVQCIPIMTMRSVHQNLDSKFRFILKILCSAGPQF